MIQLHIAELQRTQDFSILKHWKIIVSCSWHPVEDICIKTVCYQIKSYHLKLLFELFVLFWTQDTVVFGATCLFNALIGPPLDLTQFRLALAGQLVTNVKSHEFNDVIREIEQLSLAESFSLTGRFGSSTSSIVKGERRWENSSFCN